MRGDLGAGAALFALRMLRGLTVFALGFYFAVLGSIPPARLDRDHAYYLGVGLVAAWMLTDWAHARQLRRTMWRVRAGSLA